MKKVYIFILVFVSLFCLASFVLAACGTNGGIPNPLGNTCDFSTLLTNIAAQVGTLITILGTIMIFIAGILYLTSAGSPERIGTAKKALIYAIAGIVIGLAANAIVIIIKGILGTT